MCCVITNGIVVVVDSYDTDPEDVGGVDFVRIRDTSRNFPAGISGHDFNDAPTGCDDVTPVLEKTKTLSTTPGGSIFCSN